ncbi:hypothetical protein [Micromonospora sp. WMMD980]|uniref:hypothetical protein n=1 Tax=Micromonospora sp. WMMD980 TaxID=3016088 RepID=UPI002416E5F7|nr:hypothetical protein [Micromonospora sp. WMMD980]MDG4801617.1 hypothetical protein [Micromonospora sp. WMMD980]
MPPTDLLRVRDLVPDALAALGECRSVDAERWPHAWRSRYLARHPGVFGVLDRGGDWSDPEAVTAAVAGLRDRVADLAARAEAVRELLPTGVADAAGALGWSGEGGPVECVVLVGLRQANGWADDLGGRYALFLAVEGREPDDDALLVRHEAAHVVHDRRAGIRDWPSHGVANQLFAEGLATQVTAELDPGRPVEAYLWFGRPDHRAWLDECRRRWSEIVGRVRADLDATDPDHHAAYFLMRASPLRGDLPRRCGYLVGLAAVRRLRARHPLPELAGWSLRRVGAEMRGVLADLAPPA